MASTGPERARRNSTEPVPVRRHWKKKKVRKNFGVADDWERAAEMEEEVNIPRELYVVAGAGYIDGDLDVWLPPAKRDRLLRAKLVLNCYEEMIESKVMRVQRGHVFFANRLVSDIRRFIAAEDIEDIDHIDDNGKNERFRVLAIGVLLMLLFNVNRMNDVWLRLCDMEPATVLHAFAAVSKKPTPTEDEIDDEWNRAVDALGLDLR